MDPSAATSCADLLQVPANARADPRWNSYYVVVKHWYVNDPILVPC